MRAMRYRGGYDYQLAEDIVFRTTILGQLIDTVRIRLEPTGLLTVREGYAFDGPTGCVHRKENMSASCLHDALYQLMRMELLPHRHWRAADYDYARQLRRCGAWGITVKINLAGLKFMGGKYALPKNRKKIYEVPA